MKGLKKFIWDKLDKGECVLDQDIAKFVGKENEINFSMVEYYKNQWISFNNTKEYFRDIVEAGNYEIKRINMFPGNCKHLIRDKNWPKNQYKQIPKLYYDYLINLNN